MVRNGRTGISVSEGIRFSKDFSFTDVDFGSGADANLDGIGGWHDVEGHGTGVCAVASGCN